MNKSMAVSLVLAGLGIGCAVGAVATNLVVPKAQAETGASRWEYTCEKNPSGFGVKTENYVDFWNKMGAQGWRKYEERGPETCFIREYGGASGMSTSQLIGSSETPSN